MADEAKSLEPLDLDTERYKESVIIGKKPYFLVELNGDQLDFYQQDVNKRLKIENGKSAGLTSVAGLTTFLISLCLFNEKMEPVAETIIKQWGAKTLNALNDRCRKINGLGEEEAKEVKKA